MKYPFFPELFGHGVSCRAACNNILSMVTAVPHDPGILHTVKIIHKINPPLREMIFSSYQLIWYDRLEKM